MQLIPVIDLKDGVVVHARRGIRDNYQPLQPNADVFAVIDGFLALHEFKTLYIADLNAIMKQGDNKALIKNILQRYAQIDFWLDTGEISHFHSNNYLTVLGSEWCSVETLLNCQRFVLSLDFSDQDKPLGDARLFEDNSLWSKQVIIMTLARVGSESGADISKLKEYVQQHQNTEFVAAGGVRDVKDLQVLHKLGIRYVLLASALHSGIISKKEIANVISEARF